MNDKGKSDGPRNGDVKTGDVTGAGILIGKDIKTDSIEINTIYQNLDIQKISYVVLEVNTSKSNELLQEVASIINLKLTEDGEQIPFVPPIGFEQWEKISKLFLFGVSGCGRSRIVYELLKRKIQNVDRVYIINPHISIGKDSEKTTITELVQNILQKKDLIIWDGFPAGLIDEGNEQVALSSLVKISSGFVKNLLVGLKPEYLETYQGLAQVTLVVEQVIYSEGQIRNIITSYGRTISKFQGVFSFVEKKLEDVLRALWDRERTPLAISLYYEKAAEQISMGKDVVKIAEEFELPKQHYQKLFRDISRDKPRCEFLYALKLCFELKLTRKIEDLRKLQKDIFGSDSPTEPTEEIRPFVYRSSSGEYGIPDLARSVIEFLPARKSLIINYISSAPFLKSFPDNSSAYTSFGSFIGKNIEEFNSSNSLLPANLHDFMNEKKGFKEGLVSGIASIYSSLKEDTQKRIWQIVEEDLLFGVLFIPLLAQQFSGLEEKDRQKVRVVADRNPDYNQTFAIGIGFSFSTLDKDLQVEILGLAEKSGMFSRGLGVGLGSTGFPSISKDIQGRIWGLVDKNEVFASGFGLSIGTRFPYLGQEIQKKILAVQSPTFHQTLFYGLSYNFELLRKDFQDRILDLARQDEFVSTFIGSGFGVAMVSLREEVQDKLWDLASKSEYFSNGFACSIFYLGLSNTNKFLSSKPIQDRLWDLARKNKGCAIGLASMAGIRFPYLTEAYRNKMWDMIGTNEYFAYGLGYGLGKILLGYFYPDLFLTIYNKAAGLLRNKKFAYGLGYGLSIVSFSSLSEDVQGKISGWVGKSKPFAKGLAIQLSLSFPYLTQDIQDKVWDLVDSNDYFSGWLGRTFKTRFETLENNIQAKILKVAERNKSFKNGLKKNEGH